MEVTQETTPSQSGSDQFVGGYPRIRDQHKFHSNPELIGVFEEVEGCEILVVARSVLIVRFLDGGVFMEGQIRTVEASRFHELANDDCEEIVSAFTHHAYIEPEAALEQVELKIEISMSASVVYRLRCCAETPLVSIGVDKACGQRAVSFVQIPVQKKEKRKQSSQVKAQDNGRLEDKTTKR